MSSPFTTIMAQRAAFTDGHRSDEGVVSNVSTLNLTDIAGQPPLSQGREGVAFKVNAPPLTPKTLDLTPPKTLDLGGNTYGSNSEVNNAGILRRTTIADSTSGTQGALKAPETVALKADRSLPTIESITFAPTENSALKTATFKTAEADAQITDGTVAKRAPALSLPNFAAVYEATGGKFANASYNLSMQPDGSIKHKYTADDFTTCTLTSKDGSATAIVTDSFARPTVQEDINNDGNSRVTRYTYKDEGNRKSMFAASKEVTEADGTVKTYNYDKFGKVLQA